MFFYFISSAQTGVKMEKKNGVFYIPCKINGLALQFILDTGASDVTISKSESVFMLKNGFLDKSDILDKQYYELADGKITEGTNINIKRIEIGDIVLENVSASVVDTQASPLLLGQSVLERFDEVNINYNNRILTLTKKDIKFESKQEQKSTKEELLSKILFSTDLVIENPKNTEAILDIAKAKIEIGESESALKDLNTIIQINDNHVDAFYYRAKILALSNKKHKAIHDFDKVIALSPHHAEAFYERGLLKIEAKDYLSAIQDFDKAILLSPSRKIEIIKQRAHAKFEIKAFADAIKDYDALIALETNRLALADIHFYLGLSKKNIKDYQGAYAEFSRANELNESEINYLINRADMLVMINDYKNALKDFSQLIEKNPKDVELYYRRAHIKTLVKDLRGALNDYEQILNLDSNEEKVYALKADIYYNLSEFENALTNYDLALNFQKNDIELLISKANTLTQLKHYEDAIEVYNLVINHNPKDVDAYTNRGLAYFQLDKLIPACSDWSKAGELGFEGVYEFIKKYCN